MTLTSKQVDQLEAMARAEGHEEGYSAGLEDGARQQAGILDSTLGEMVLDLIHKRDVLGLDIGDPLERLRIAGRGGA